MTETDAFKHSTPELYDRFMRAILQTAVSTGIVTRERAVDAVTEALVSWDGKEATMSAHVVTATP